MKDGVEQTLVHDVCGEEAAEREEERAQQSEQRVGDGEREVHVHVEGHVQLQLAAARGVELHACQQRVPLPQAEPE